MLFKYFVCADIHANVKDLNEDGLCVSSPVKGVGDERIGKILLVDDEPGIRFLVHRLLDRAGYEVVEARDGEEGLKKLEKDSPDLVLLDLILPGIDGWQVCERIKRNETTRGIPVAIFSVRGSPEDMKRSQECGAEVHITKPFRKNKLLNTVRYMIKKEPAFS
jgi:DNA-binding response OmpR family regulator